MASERDAYDVLQVAPGAHHVVVRAAYRALAALYHPDRDNSAAATRRMAELNDAYAKVSTPDRRAEYDSLRRPAVASFSVANQPAPRQRAAQRGTLDFGRYSGWTIEQLARHDPDYLRWLRRHSSGLRFRSEIERYLPQEAPPADTVRRNGRRR